MNKSEFTKKILKMGYPIMKEIMDCEWPLLSSVIVVIDRDDFKKKFECSSSRLSQPEYHSGDFNNYELRRKRNLVKYERWMHDVFGAYCTSKLTI